MECNYCSETVHTGSFCSVPDCGEILCPGCIEKAGTLCGAHGTNASVPDDKPSQDLPMQERSSDSWTGPRPLEIMIIGEWPCKPANRKHKFLLKKARGLSVPDVLVLSSPISDHRVLLDIVIPIAIHMNPFVAYNINHRTKQLERIDTYENIVHLAVDTKAICSVKHEVMAVAQNVGSTLTYNLIRGLIG